MNTTTQSPCIVLSWSSDTAGTRKPTLYICIMATIIHTIFWIHFLFYSSIRQRGMFWLYVYLLTDLFLIFRFFLFYGQRISMICVPRSARTILCYFEAISKIYTNVIQSYILLGLNVCRYIQIVFNRNVYIKNVRSLILSNLAIYIIPMLNIIIQFLVNWTQLWRQLGGICDIKYMSVYVQIFNIFIVYFIPVTLNIIFIFLCIRFISSTGNIRNQQIINNRRKFHMRLVIQSVVFYSIWLILWSPFVLSFQFVNANTSVGIVTSMLNYIQIALDPAIVAIIDMRFYKAWKKTFTKIIRKRKRQRQTLPTKITEATKRY
ncbi:unnamed protein product [Adineta ricciae]|uniref:G-protein coupled receptors family 1 profile domain-containing protein n=1 Tax=Adineta ricciae TaxID=249248 RepID=A0A814Y2R6_ADIRI|nr:unnamed protein product [Adineta ricciae]CAF1437587.1 unnamed protein product [Adineta ricciae]